MGVRALPKRDSSKLHWRRLHGREELHESEGRIFSG